MRLRIRGPSGQSTVNLDDTATIATLRKSITDQTSLTSYDVKFGYPPKPLPLDRYSPDQSLATLDIKLNGEQLLVTRSDSSSDANSVKPRQDIEQTKLSKPSASTPSSKAVPVAENPPKSSSGKAPAAPLSLTRKENKEMSDPPEIFMPDVGGTLVLRIMPDDNSCLFRAISSAVMSDLDAVTELRSIVAEAIQADPERFNKAVLDNKDPNKYCRWIRSQDSWGGQVELLILSQHFQVEICSIDVQTLRVDRYNEGATQRCFVVYSGIHYDTIALTLPGLPPEQDIKQFESPIKEEILPQAVALCRKLQEQHYFTDTAAFQLKCHDCGAMLVGERGATEHASQTGHYNFGEAG